jgi:hypothetical protein
MASAATRPTSRLAIRRQHRILAMVFVFIALRLLIVAAPYLGARSHSSTVPKFAVAVTADGESNFPERTQQQKECRFLPRRLFVSGTGTVELRTNRFVSRHIELGDSPQEIELPGFRPAAGDVWQYIVVEGKADFLHLTTDSPKDQLDVKALDGAASFAVDWTPLPANC